LENAADLLSVRVIGSDQEFNNELASVGAANKPVIVFLHGYNNSFSDALRRAATIKNDIAGDGTVISYTWPSDGSALGYGYDASSASTASQNFQSFMDALTKKVPRKQIHIIAHSMGGRILIDYIVKLQNTQTPTIELKFANLIFAASDITQDLFEQKVAGPRDEPERSLIAFAKTVTVYSSEYDRALGFSHEIHRDKRLGLSTKQDLFLASGLVTIDASSIDPAKFYQKFTTATRHSYVFDKAKGVSDLAGIIANVSPQDRTGLVQDARGQKIFWRMR
jgi:esterase/lipase superfamily enzyme